MEMNDKPTTVVLEGKDVTVVPLTYKTSESGGSISYNSTWNGKQTIYLKKAAE